MSMRAMSLSALYGLGRRACTIPLEYAKAGTLAGATMALPAISIGVLFVIFMSLGAVSFLSERDSNVSESSFRYAITDILSLRSEKKMGRVYARRVVAGMTNMDFVRDGAYVNFVTIPMGQYISRSSTGPMEHSVAIMIEGSSPNPAKEGIKTQNFIPEPVFHRSSFVSHKSIPSTEVSNAAH